MENIINELRYFNKRFPRETLKEAIRMKEEITPILLGELDKIIDCPEIVTENQDYMLHIYAIYLLAQFKEKRAFGRFIDLISLTPDEADIFFGDVLTEKMSAILFSTFDGNLNLLKSVIENPLLNIYARSAALDVFGELYSDGILSKDECIGYLKELIYDNNYDMHSDLATDVLGLVIEKHFFDMIDDMQFLYDLGRIDTMMFGKYDEFIDFIYSYEYEREWVPCIDDIIKEMYWWSCFEQTKDEKRKREDQIKKLKESIDKEEKIIKRMFEKPKKTGRNDPCTCGSGKKYKKCCLEKESTIEVEPKKKFIESAEAQKEWLKYYPIKEGERKEGEIRITDLFDRESIDIDKSVYLALHHRAIPIWIERDKNEEEMVMISYLIEAYEKFLSKCEKEGISSFDEYDSKYKIHYRSKKWIERLEVLIDENDLEYEYDDSLKKINKTIAKFS